MRTKRLDSGILFPSFAGYADLMSALCLLFIVASAIMLRETKEQKSKINELEEENAALIEEINQLKKDLPTIPKKIIIPNELDGKVFFNSCEATIQSDFYGELDKLTDQITTEINNGNFNFVEVEGHTDKQQISSCAYEDNWELGAARAIAVVQYLISKGIRPEQLSAVSHAEFKPTDTGDDEDAFSKNRRIEIILLRK